MRAKLINEDLKDIFRAKSKTEIIQKVNNVKYNTIKKFNENLYQIPNYIINRKDLKEAFDILIEELELDPNKIYGLKNIEIIPNHPRISQIDWKTQSYWPKTPHPILIYVYYNNERGIGIIDYSFGDVLYPTIVNKEKFLNFIVQHFDYLKSELLNIS